MMSPFEKLRAAERLYIHGGIAIGFLFLVLLLGWASDIAARLDLSVVAILSVMALSMAFLWGQVGILSFGQTAFFGVGGYAYAVVSLATDDSFAAILAGMLAPMAVAFAFGYFTIYGRIRDIYMSVMTMVLTLMLEKSLRATSAPQYQVGGVKLGGENGIPGVPPLSLTSSYQLGIDGVFVTSAVVLACVYFGLRVLRASPWGLVLAGVRENERRMELLGYNTRWSKLLIFTICGGLAGLSGSLFAIWGSFVSPEMFGLRQAAEVVVWVIVGGKATLLGPIVGTAFVQSLSKWLGTQSVGQVTLALGAVLILSVMFMKRGIAPEIEKAVVAFWSRFRRDGR